MGFWAKFSETKSIKEQEKFSSLHHKISTIMPQASEKELTLVACIAGLLARVAYTNLNISNEETQGMRKLLKQWTSINDRDIDAIVKLTIQEMKSLSGIENHKYCYPLNDILDNDEKMEVLISLFAIAASDNDVEQKESEEIRSISKGLLLEHQHFISARSTVIEHLRALK